MAKLYFRYGAVGSAKTLNLLAVAHNYRQQEKQVLILKPEIDTRFGVGQVRSRAGLEQEADMILRDGQAIDESRLPGIDCLLVDEAQFLDPAAVDQLRHIASSHNIPVICYGLRTDYRRGLFAGSRRLLELADSIEEVKTTCFFCTRKAIFNLKMIDGRAVGPDDNGPTVDLGCEEKYLPSCAVCYAEKAVSRSR
jgi:thymidine kinase